MLDISDILDVIIILKSRKVPRGVRCGGRGGDLHQLRGIHPRDLPQEAEAPGRDSYP
jgi:hypothetical protein